MNRFATRLKELRISHALSQQSLADRIQMSKSSVNMWERGEREPGLEMLETLADFFNVDLDYLMGKSNIPNRALESSLYDYFDNIRPIETKKIPFLGSIACGEPIYASEARESYVEIGTDINADFCLKAKGDSMINARIHDGDIVFIKKQDMVENGEIAAVIIGDEATLKRVYYDRQSNKLVLMAENPTYSPFVYENEELDKIKVLGKAVAFQSDIK